jgi:serine/threonine kinase 38
MTVKDFQSISIIGRGAFGEVRLCRTKENQLVAIKKMKK